MKPADLQDIVIMQDTTTLAFETLKNFASEIHALNISFSTWQIAGETVYLIYAN